MPQPVLHFPPSNHSLLSLVSFLAANQLLVSHNAVSVIRTIQSKSFLCFTHCRHSYLTGICFTQCITDSHLFHTQQSHSYMFHTLQSQLLSRHLLYTMPHSHLFHTQQSHSYMFHTLQSQLLSRHLFYTQQSQSPVSHTAVTVTCFTHCSHSYLICTCCTQCCHRQLHV